MGGLQTYPEALKAFRRASYKFPGVWRAVVVCDNTIQLKYAMDEAMRIFDGSSLEAKRDALTWTLTTDRDTKLMFATRTTLHTRATGLEIPHVILLAELDATEEAEYRARHRHSDIEPEQLIWVNSTL